MTKNFVNDKQFKRAGKILRKLMYKNTMKHEDRPEGLPYFNYRGGGSEPVIGVEGHKMLYIEIPSFSVRPVEIENIRAIEEIKERDDIVFSEDGFKLYIEREKE
jgi:hypothetical protein